MCFLNLNGMDSLINYFTPNATFTDKDELCRVCRLQAIQEIKYLIVDIPPNLLRYNID